MTWDVEEHKKADKELDRQWQLKRLRLLQKGMLYGSNSDDKRVCMICKNFNEDRYLYEGIMLCKRNGHNTRMMREMFDSVFQEGCYANIDKCGKDGKWFEKIETL